MMILKLFFIIFLILCMLNLIIKKMKNKFIISAILVSCMSCATILGGSKTDQQRHKPNCGEPKRQLRIGFLIADCIFFPPGIIIDFCTKKIYKRFPNENKLKQCKEAK